MTKFTGIDVSHWQGEIDWAAVKKSGIDFAIIRLGYGLKKDKQFTANITGALANKIKCGIYLYSLASTEEEAVKEADFVLKAIKKYKIVYPIFYDIEDNVQYKLTNSVRTKLCIAFCNQIAAANYIPGIYSSTTWFQSKFQLKKLKKYEKWVAHWGVVTPNYDGAYSIWQYSSTGSLNGIAGNVDLNYCYVDYTKYAQNFKAGKKLVLKSIPIYTSSIKKTASATVTGTYFIYDGILMNQRFRITNQKKKVNQTPVAENVSGYVTLKDLTNS